MICEKYIIDGISVSPDTSEAEALGIAESRLRRAGIRVSDCELSIFKKSVDARRKTDVRLVYAVAVTSRSGSALHSKMQRLNARRVKSEVLNIEHGDKPLIHRPMVVGMGPAGMLCALLLAQNGLRPLLIDRGDSVADRVRAVDTFYKTAVLDTESNIQFGAGGAGTFSDGKLVTRINDEKCAYVLDTLHRFGAPDDILLKAKPHIGTDILRGVVENILSEIQELGGEVIYRCRMTDLDECSDGVRVLTTKGEFICSDAVLALGHSARDTYYTLIRKNFSVAPKPISVGVRIEHLREDIERALYGNFAGHKNLGSAEYALSDTKGARGVYTFCMCPGGEVMAATSEEGGVVVNGMSEYARDGRNSNSAVLATVRPDDIEKKDGSLALGVIEFQRRTERLAFSLGGGNFSAPVQTVGDFMSGGCGTEPSRIMPTYMGGKCTVADMSRVLPSFACDELKYGLSSFDKKISGFACADAVLTGAETRTSAPVRILRGENMCALGYESIYPCGEGAGYAGGITSAAVDGINTALAIIKKYKKI